MSEPAWVSNRRATFLPIPVTTGWIDHNTGDTSPGFYPGEVIEVQYRDGRQATGDKPWEASGWNHIGSDWPNDIVKYRFLKKSSERK